MLPAFINLKLITWLLAPVIYCVEGETILFALPSNAAGVASVAPITGAETLRMILSISVLTVVATPFKQPLL